MSRVRLPIVTLPLVLGLLALTSLGCDRRKAIDEYNRGVGYAQAGEYPRAILAFETALELRPKFPEANNSLGYVYNQLRNYEKAIVQFQAAAAAEKFKDRHLAYQNLGTAYSNNAQYEDAEAPLAKSIEMQPTADAHYALAQVYALQKKTASCIGALRDAMALDEERIRAVDGDAAFDAIREDAEFRAFVAEAR
ncbi:hypothetical protein CMK11_07995 [Candidatus Poribacteria bacterium]|nr:hypothetical protein [Candidatus Poribacteria bacterium]